VAFWIATEILQTQGSKMQAMVIKKVHLPSPKAMKIKRVLKLIFGQFVDVASQCYEMGNFNTLMEIISGLSHSSVKRLKVSKLVFLAYIYISQSH